MRQVARDRQGGRISDLACQSSQFRETQHLNADSDVYCVPGGQTSCALSTTAHIADPARFPMATATGWAPWARDHAPGSSLLPAEE